MAACGVGAGASVGGSPALGPVTEAAGPRAINDGEEGKNMKAHESRAPIASFFLLLLLSCIHLQTLEVCRSLKVV